MSKCRALKTNQNHISFVYMGHRSSEGWYVTDSREGRNKRECVTGLYNHSLVVVASMVGSEAPICSNELDKIPYIIIIILCFDLFFCYLYLADIALFSKLFAWLC